MVENPMFYRKIVPLNREVHKALKVDMGRVRFGFSREAHMIPTVIDEFVPAARSLPIVFVPGTPRPTPVFLLGLRPGENYFVDRDGGWTANYVPAFLRRYPFIIGEVKNGEPLVCIDEKAGAFSEATGEPLFLENGDHAPALRNTISFVNDYLLAAKRTEAFVDDLQALGLFRTITIDVRPPGGQATTLHGVINIDPDRFQGLPDDAFLSLRAKGFLPAIYAHLSSLAMLDALAAGAAKPGSDAGEQGADAETMSAASADIAGLPN